MHHPRETLDLDMVEVFGDIAAAVCGGVATRAYAPERVTHDVDVLVDHARYDEARERLQAQGWKSVRDLFFPNASLGLYGTAWTKDGRKLDVIASDRQWAVEALATPAYDQTGLRVLPLAYLVLMKTDSARGIDHGDLSRMLGRLNAEQLDAVVAVVRRHHRDPRAAEDVRQYGELGALEYWTPETDG